MCKTKTVLGRTLEEIKEEVSRELLHPYRTWLENSRFSNDDNISVLEDSGAIDEVAERYAQSQTQELKEQNDNLANNLLEMSNSLVGLIKENNNLKDLSNTITGLQLQEQNAELVEMLNHWFLEYGYGADRFQRQELVDMTESLLTKYNHLKSNTNGNI